MASWALLASIGVLLVPACLSRYFLNNPGHLKIFSLASMLALGSAILLVVVPEAVEHIGYIALFWLACGFLMATFLEHRVLARLDHLNGAVYLLLLGFMAIHSLLDGAVLASASHLSHHGSEAAGHHHHHHAEMMGFGVVIHRLSTVTLLWLGLTGKTTLLFRWLLMGTMGLATLAGFWGMPTAWAVEHHVTLEVFVAGWLLHLNVDLLRRPSGQVQPSKLSHNI